MKGYVELTAGQHYAKIDGHTTWKWQGWNHPLIAPYKEYNVIVNHFKWDATCVERIKEVADIDKPYAYSAEYKTMYNAIKVFDWKIDICNPEFKVEKLNNFSYIDYMDYSKWNLLRDKIITI